MGARALAPPQLSAACDCSCPRREAPQAAEGGRGPSCSRWELPLLSSSGTHKPRSGSEDERRRRNPILPFLNDSRFGLATWRLCPRLTDGSPASTEQPLPAFPEAVGGRKQPVSWHGPRLTSSLWFGSAGFVPTPNPALNLLRTRGATLQGHSKLPPAADTLQFPFGSSQSQSRSDVFRAADTLPDTS